MLGILQISGQKIREIYTEDNKIINGIKDIESEFRDSKDINIHLSAELSLQIAIRLMNENSLEESRKWLFRTIHKTRSVIDVNSTMEIPNKYLEMIDSKKLVEI